MSIFPSFNYIGSKMKLLDYISTSIQEYTGKRVNKIKGFADPFSGTGIVVYHMLKNGCKNVLVNDIQHYAYVVSSSWCLSNIDVTKVKELLTNLNHLNSNITDDDIEISDDNFISMNYTELGPDKSMYFTVENGYKIDKTRQNIQKLKDDNKINEDEFKLILKILLYAVAKISNIASVYGAYLKYYKSSSLKPLLLDISLVDKLLNDKTIKIQAYNKNITQLLDENNFKKYEVTYIDPPYVSNRNYDSNYHLLETISKYDNPVIKGKTGTRDETNTKSKFCSKREAHEAFNDILSKIKSKYIFISYSSESILSKEEMTCLLAQNNWKNIKVYEKEHGRFRSNDLTDPDQTVIEYIFCGVKD
jgi:adenine-specific DNA-methyltransferase